MDYTPRWGKMIRHHPLEAIKQKVHRFFSGYDPHEGRKNLHGQYPTCNWYPPTLPEKNPLVIFHHEKNPPFF